MSDLITIMTIHGRLRRVSQAEYERAKRGELTLVRAYADGVITMLHIDNIVPRMLLSEKDQAMVS